MLIKAAKVFVWGWRVGKERGVCGSDGAGAMSYIVVDSAWRGLVLTLELGAWWREQADEMIHPGR